MKWHFIPICFLLVSCDLTVDLPNNYSLIKLSGSTFAISGKNGELAVNADVLNVSCHKSIIVGLKVLEDGLDTEAMFKQREERGYFILHAKSGELRQGLSKHAYAEALKEMGLKYIEPTPIESWKRPLYGLDGC